MKRIFLALFVLIPILASAEQLQYSPTKSGGSGTVTSIASGNGIAVSPSPITGTGTVSIANNPSSPYSLAGYLNSGVFGNVTIGTGVNISGAGVLTATGTPGGSSGSVQYNNSGSFGGFGTWNSTNDWLGINITPEATLDILNTQAFNSGMNTAGRFQATGTLGNFAVTVADPANHVGISVNTPDFTTTINDEFNGVGLNMYSSAIASTLQLLSDGGTILNAYDSVDNANITIGNGVFFQANSPTTTVSLGGAEGAGFFIDSVNNVATFANNSDAGTFGDGSGTYTAYLGRNGQFAGWFIDSSANQVYLADGNYAINATGPIQVIDPNTLATNFQVQTGGFVGTLNNTIDDSFGNSSIAGSLVVNGVITNSTLTPNTALIANGSHQIVSSATTSTELGYVSGVTSAIQTQLNAKLAFTQVSISSNVTLAAFTINLVNTASAARSLQMPAPSSGAILYVKDISFNAQNENITFTQHASENLEGVAGSYIFAANGGSVLWYSDGTNWYIIG